MKGERSETTAGRNRLRKGDRLPSIALKTCMREGAVRVRPSRGPRVFVAMHRPDCVECARYVGEVASIREQVESWGADILVVSAESVGTDNTVLRQLGLPVLLDPAGTLADGRLTVIIADEWGEAWFADETKGMHGCVSVQEVAEWVKFIAIQCPECEAPEGEWRNL